MRTVMRCTLVGIALLGTLSGCVAPRYFIDIPAISTPQREARYWRTQDAANAVAGFAVDQGLRYVFKGPTDRVGARMWVDSLGAQHTETFRWRSGEMAPVYRVSTVLVLGGLRRQIDRGYRESGWLMNVVNAFANEWLHFMIAGVRGHF